MNIQIRNCQKRKSKKKCRIKINARSRLKTNPFVRKKSFAFIHFKSFERDSKIVQNKLCDQRHKFDLLIN